MNGARDDHPQRIGSSTRDRVATSTLTSASEMDGSLRLASLLAPSAGEELFDAVGLLRHAGMD